VWYYIIVGEGESLPIRNTNSRIYYLLKGNLIPMRTVDFSALKVGDIILFDTPNGSTPRVQGKGFLTSRDTGWLPEIHPLSLCGVSRRCPPTETFAPNNACSGLDVHMRVIHPFIRLSPSRRRAHILSVSSLGCVCLAWGVGRKKNHP